MKTLKELKELTEKLRKGAMITNAKRTKAERKRSARKGWRMRRAKLTN